MYKTIILLTIFLTSCNSSNNYEWNIKNSENVADCDWTNPYEQCEIVPENIFIEE